MVCGRAESHLQLAADAKTNLFVGSRGRTARRLVRHGDQRHDPARRMETERFNYDLPEELIAQRPTDRREESRLFHYDRATGAREHTTFSNITGFLRAGDVLVFNDTKVIPARLFGKRRTANGERYGV